MEENVTKKRLKKTNDIFFIICSVQLLLVYLDYVKQWLIGQQAFSKVALIMAPMLLIHVFITIWGLQSVNYSNFRWVAVAGFEVILAISLIWNINERSVYLAQLALLMVGIIYLDEKLVKFSILGMILVNILNTVARLIYLKEARSATLTTFATIAVTIVSFSWGLLKVMQRIRVSHEEYEAAMRQEMHKQQDMLVNIFDAIHILDQSTASVEQVVTQFADSSQSVKESINEITTGADEVSRNVHNQTEMTAIIRDLIKEAASGFRAVQELSMKSQEHLNEGTKMIGDVSIKTIRAAEQNQYTYEMMQELKERSQKVYGITEMIAGISDQTNLLSLNAAIESARAGEAGKGFSVVAEEIRKLSMQTQELTNNISTIILELVNKVEQTEMAVEELNTINKEQNELIEANKKIFIELTDNMNESNEKVKTVNEKVEHIVESNNNIVEGIHRISTISKETTSYAQNANGIALDNAESARTAQEYVKQLMSVSDKLKKYI